MGRPPVVLKIVSKIRAGIKCTKIAEILYHKIDGNIFRWGYHTADNKGYLQRSSVIFSETCIHLKGFLVLELT